jgi:hypothetical protein
VFDIDGCEHALEFRSDVGGGKESEDGTFVGAGFENLGEAEKIGPIHRKAAMLVPLNICDRIPIRLVGIMQDDAARNFIRGIP